MAGETSPTAIRRLIENLAMAAAYFAVGRLSLLLAIPPGYATAVWPAAGLALAGMLLARGRVWPGVLIGHFLVNVFTAIRAGDDQSALRSVGAAVCIAVGGTLQAALGAWLIRKSGGFPSRLDLERGVMRFLVLGGPVSCTLGASVGVGSLLAFGVLEFGDAPFNWFTWWVGDAIGVMLVAPMAAIWPAPRTEVPLERKLAVTIPLCFMLAIAVAYFVVASGLEEIAMRQSAPQARGWLAWACLTVALLFTAMMSAFLMVVTGRTAAVERLVKDRTRELEALNRELEAFGYSVAHDLRAPLTAIFGASRMLAESRTCLLDQRGREQLAQVLNETQHMSGLIDELLRLSRLSRAPMRVESVDLSELARQVLVELSGREPQRHVTFEIHEGIKAPCDSGLVKVALENLLGNAWKFTSKRPDARIVFSREKTAEGDTFCVRDNGAGFDMKNAGHLFAPFQRLHPAPEFEGTGVGLATVKRIINRHGGRVWAQATPNEGASFFFTLGAHAASNGNGKAA